MAKAAHAAIVLLAACSVQFAAAFGPDDTLCSFIDQYTPSFCTCSSLDGKKYNAKLVCDKTLLGQTIAATIDVEPCNTKPLVSFSISFDGIPWSISLVSGEHGQVGIPGCSFDILGIKAGAVLDYSLSLAPHRGTDDLGVALGLDACAGVGTLKKCGSGLTHYLPLTFLNVSFPINDFCNMTQIQAHRLLNGYTKDGVKI